MNNKERNDKLLDNIVLDWSGSLSNLLLEEAYGQEQIIDLEDVPDEMFIEDWYWYRIITKLTYTLKSLLELREQLEYFTDMEEAKEAVKLIDEEIKWY